MFARQLCRLRPALTRRLPVRSRHMSLPAEFRALDRMMDDFFRQPMILSRPSFRRRDLLGEFESRLHLHENDGKLIAQMGLPEGVKPEDVKISLKDDCLSVSFRFESKRENFTSVSEFHEKLKLDQVDFEKMEAMVDTHEGVLRIEAPLKDNKAGESQVKLNIDRSGGDSKKIES
ncbi:uncharacterized protein LOC100900878 [Galendromus occidentalis]|uniref:Uncharacterized protein LOC100900878 n=1 Tax=Galendromus occidentalis TaxID=34638 RepID=A0AAJ6QT22_9ACAR|nr:uncharacterized protein LOC100900878 [Galendromus occidentalis]